jgi:hypothetical protein
LPRTLHHGLSYNLDVLVIVCEGSEIRVCNDKREWLRWPRLREIFADKGDYILTIKLAGDGAETKTVDIQFNWTGYWQTSFLTLLNEQSPPLTERGRLKVSFDGDSLDCMWPTIFRTEDGQLTGKGVIARLRVDSETESGISECKVALTSLEKNSKPVVSGVKLPLLFTPAQSPGSDKKAIKYGQPEYLELLWIPELDEPEIMTNFPNAFSEYSKLDRQSAYSLHIAFSVDNTITKIIVNAEYRSNAWRLSIIRSAVGKA